MTAATRTAAYIPAPPLTAPLEIRAKAVWEQLLLSKPEPSYADTSYYGLAGRVVRANVRTIVRYLWPVLREEAREKELEHAVNEIRAHLGKTNSAKCLARHGDTKDRTPIWWVCGRYEPIAVHIFRMTPRERRLSAHEAGEDREPEPVTVRRIGEPENAAEPVSEEAAEPVTAPELLEPEPVPTEPREPREVLLEALRSVSEPVTRNEWSVAAGFPLLTYRGRPAGPPSRAVSAMASLVSMGLAFNRLETREERKIRGGLAPDDPAPVAKGAALYWPSQPVPPRTKRQVVPGYLFDPRVFTTEEKQQFTLRGLLESKRRVVDVLDAMGTDSFITMRRLASLAGVADNHAVAAFNDLLEERVLQVRRKGDDFWRTAVRLARDRRATDAESYRRKSTSVKGINDVSPTAARKPADDGSKPAPRPGQDIAQFVADYIESEVQARLDAELANRDSELVEAQDRVSELEAQVAKLKAALKAFTE